MTELQECEDVCGKCRKSSDLYKSGELYKKKPATYRDVTCSSSFRNDAMICGKATSEQAHDLRIVGVGWTDEFTTVDGLGTAAKEHKYGAVLLALINLPAWMRHHFAYILLLCLYRTKYAKEHGGLVRMLTGKDQNGVQHRDGLTLAAELELGRKEGMLIELPNDDYNPEDPDSPVTITVRLRIFLLLISLDWLASGDFGPFAASVSARYPCGKCMWTAACPCAYKPSFANVQHSAHCRRSALRTHDSVMHVVHELRTWQGTRAGLQALKTSNGIMSPHFASELLLWNIVRDSTIDIMHVFDCGVLRYALSWVTDVFCPADFTFPDLNVRKNAHDFGDVRVPDLERALGSSRGSCSIRINGAQMRAFAIARLRRAAFSLLSDLAFS